MDVYVALNSVPDYNAPAPSFKSVHMTLEDAIRSLYPDRKDFQLQFTPGSQKDTWNGPDGFGMVRKVELQEPQYSIQIRFTPTEARGKEQTEKLMQEVIEYLDNYFRQQIEIVDSEVYL